MEAVKAILKPRPTPQQQMREWQRRLKQECRNIDRHIRDIQREEKKVQKEVKDAAKRNDMTSAKVTGTARQEGKRRAARAAGRFFCGAAGPHSSGQPRMVHTSCGSGRTTYIQQHTASTEEGFGQGFLSGSANQNLAKEIVRSRRAIQRLYENRAQMNSISMHLGESVATARAVGHLSKSTEVMKLVNGLMKAPEVAATMQEFTTEMTKAGVIEETVNDSLDSALDSEDIEEETEEEVDKVLSEIAGETAAQLPAAARREKIKQPTLEEKQKQQEQPVAEGVDDEQELEEIRARLANVRG